MLTNQEFENLLAEPELDWIDFKAESYNISIDQKKSEFIKDILCMANLPYKGKRYIIFGIKIKDNGEKEFLGIASHNDDSDLQDIINKASVYPRPKFVYMPFTYNSKSYGILEIDQMENGPFFANKDFGVVQAQRIYTRRGTKNTEADQYEMRKIYESFSTNPKQEISKSESYSQLNWGKFLQNCHNFESDRYYFFVIGPDNETPTSYWNQLANLPINLIVDFNPDILSANSIYGQSINHFKKRKSVHLIDITNDLLEVSEKGCYWFAAKGTNEKGSAIDWKTWNRYYSPNLEKLLSLMARFYVQKPITVIFLWNAPEYIRELCSIFDKTFFDSIDFVFAFPNVKSIDSVVAQFSGCTIEIKPIDLLYEIQNNYKSISLEPIIGLPDLDGSFKPIEKNDYYWLSEDMEVLHSNVESELKINQKPGLNFLKGHVITWIDLDLHLDADRDETQKLEILIRKDLSTRTPTRFNIFHYPGSGGTTIGRRIAWNLHRQYPTVILNRIIPTKTIERLRFIFELTSQPILVFLEGSDIIADSVEQLYTEIKARQIPIVMVSVLRRFSFKDSADRTVFIKQKLSTKEVYRFSEIYKKVLQTPESEDQFKNYNEIDQTFWTPFYFGLFFLEDEFEGIEKYVADRLCQTSKMQKEIISCLCLAYSYGHKSIPAQYFSKLIGLPENKVVHLRDYLPEYLLDLFVMDSDNCWRPAHQLISEEILKQLLSVGIDKRNWRYNLADLAIQFINMEFLGYSKNSQEIINLLRRVFILRDEHELLGTEISDSSQYSKIIEDIPTNQAKLIVLKQLTVSYPNEPHFWAHLGRFYSTTLNDYENALFSINHAILLNETDPVLFHMQGMCYRKKINNIIKSVVPNNYDNNIDEIKNLVNDAKISFSKSRDLDPTSEHAYISPVQLLIQVLDFGYKFSEKSTKQEYLSDPQFSWFRDQLDEAESLLESSQLIREGDRESTYFVSCKNDLELFYGNYSLAIQNWQNLLSRKDIYCPPIRRQIIRAYLYKQNKKWHEMDQKTINRIIELTESNLLEEPNQTSNIQLWFQSVRFSKNYDIDVAIEKILRWMNISQSIDSYYYLYILYALKTLQGSSIDSEFTSRFIDESSNRARSLRYRTRSIEWLGKGNGLNSLLNVSRLGNWNKETDFYENSILLERVLGTVKTIKGPEAGIITLEKTDLEAFFVPAKASLYKGKDEYQKVEFFLGFTYDGIRAWNVNKVE